MKAGLKYLALGVLLSFLSSCIFEYEVDETVEDMTPMTVVFTLDLADQAAKTKADDNKWDGNGYDTVLGTSFENRILPDNLHVLVYDNSGNYVATVQRVAYRESSDGVYEFWGILKSNNVNESVDFVKGSTYRFIVLANCGTLTFDSSGNPLPQNLVYSSTWDAVASDKSAIPMWGATDVALDMAELQNLGSISLVRSMAKIEVELSDELKGKYTITSAIITRSNTIGYSVPGNWNTTTTAALGHDAAFRPYTEAAIATGKSLYALTDGDRMIYVPELENTTNAGESGDIRIELTLNDGSSDLVFNGDKAIFLAEYKDGSPTNSLYNIVRNHYYKFIVNEVVAGKELALTLNVMPWGVLEESVKFTDEVTVSAPMTWSGTYLVPGATDNSVLYIDGAYTVANAVTAMFKIDTPVGATWYASFEGDKDAFSFITETTADDPDRMDDTTQITENGVTDTVYWKKTMSVTGNVGDEAILRVVTNSQFVSENKSVSLRVVVLTLDGRTIVVNKLLMPESMSGKDYYQLRHNLSL